MCGKLMSSKLDTRQIQDEKYDYFHLCHCYLISEITTRVRVFKFSHFLENTIVRDKISLFTESTKITPSLINLYPLCYCIVGSCS